MFVLLTPEIEDGISRIENKTLDEANIARFWKIFTSIGRSSIDPTIQAYRMENFWWRVWGSKQKILPGLELGSLCSQVCNETFNFRLHRLSCLGERSPIQSLTKPYLDCNDREELQYIQAIGLSSTSPNKPTSTGFIPHSILKKTLSPSSYSPRPSAHFISLHKPEDGNSTIDKVSSVVFQPATISSSEIRARKRHLLGPTIPTRTSTFLTKKKQPLALRRHDTYPSNDSSKKASRLVQGRSSRYSSNPDKTFSMNGKNSIGKSGIKFLEINAQVSNTERRNALTNLEPGFSGHANQRMESKRLNTLFGYETHESELPQGKFENVGASPVLHGLSDEMSRVSSSHSVTEEKSKCILETAHMEETKLILSSQISDLSRSPYIKSTHATMNIFDGEVSNQNQLSSRDYQYAASTENVQVDEGPTLFAITKDYKTNSLTSQNSRAAS